MHVLTEKNITKSKKLFHLTFTDIFHNTHAYLVAIQYAPHICKNGFFRKALNWPTGYIDSIKLKAIPVYDIQKKVFLNYHLKELHFYPQVTPSKKVLIFLVQTAVGKIFPYLLRFVSKLADLCASYLAKLIYKIAQTWGSNLLMAQVDNLITLTDQS